MIPNPARSDSATWELDLQQVKRDVESQFKVTLTGDHDAEMQQVYGLFAQARGEDRKFLEQCLIVYIYYVAYLVVNRAIRTGSFSLTPGDTATSVAHDIVSEPQQVVDTNNRVVEAYRNIDDLILQKYDSTRGKLVAFAWGFLNNSLRHYWNRRSKERDTRSYSDLEETFIPGSHTPSLEEEGEQAVEFEERRSALEDIGEVKPEVKPDEDEGIEAQPVEQEETTTESLDQYTRSTFQPSTFRFVVDRFFPKAMSLVSSYEQFAGILKWLLDVLQGYDFRHWYSYRMLAAVAVKVELGEGIALPEEVEYFKQHKDEFDVFKGLDNELIVTQLKDGLIPSLNEWFEAKKAELLEKEEQGLIMTRVASQETLERSGLHVYDRATQFNILLMNEVLGETKKRLMAAMGYSDGKKFAAFMSKLNSLIKDELHKRA